MIVDLKVNNQFPFWEQGVNCYVLHVCGESFVQPKIVPPFHGNQIAKPHVCQFMGHSQADSSHIGARAIVFAVKQLCFTECDETPIFHGARREIGYTDQIWLTKHIFLNTIFFTNFL